MTALRQFFFAHFSPGLHIIILNSYKFQEKGGLFVLKNSELKLKDVIDIKRGKTRFY